MALSIVTCRFCGKPIIWIQTINGKNMPCDAEVVEYQENKKGAALIVTERGAVVRGDIVNNNPKSPLEKVIDGKGYISHFATCKNYRRDKR